MQRDIMAARGIAKAEAYQDATREAKRQDRQAFIATCIGIAILAISAVMVAITASHVFGGGAS